MRGSAHVGRMQLMKQRLFCFSLLTLSTSLSLLITMTGSVSVAQKRIVGGQRVLRLNDRLGFLAAFAVHVKTNDTINRPLTLKELRVTCTASLISSHWALSAAHCLGKKERLNEHNCSVLDAKCITNVHGDFEFIPGRRVRSALVFGASDVSPDSLLLMSSSSTSSSTVVVEVDKMVRPKLSYEGGGYGVSACMIVSTLKTYGGYDLLLLHLSHTSPASPTCLPGPGFLDVDVSATIAGFGRTRRSTCETNGLGPSKFRYCGVEPRCQKNLLSPNLLCKVQFTLDNVTRQGCQHDMASPSLRSEVCRAFLSTRPGFFHTHPHVHEVIVVTKNKKKKEKKNEEESKEEWMAVAKCFRPMDDAGLGWCGVNLANKLEEQRIDVRAESGWGFCSSHCVSPSPGSSSSSEPMFGLAKEKRISILSDSYCVQETLDQDLSVTPQVLCVAFNRSFGVHVVDQTANFIDLHHVQRHQVQGLQPHETHDWYIAGPGSCHGDSGGPLFVRAVAGAGLGVRPVLLGVTSTGTSSIGHCGGLNNPTHYVRVKKFLNWIKHYVQQEHLCIVHTLF